MFGDTRAFSSFAVDDVGRARAFYEGTLGLRVTPTGPGDALLALHLAGGGDVCFVRGAGRQCILRDEAQSMAAARADRLCRRLCVQCVSKIGATRDCLCKRRAHCSERCERRMAPIDRTQAFHCQIRPTSSAASRRRAVAPASAHRTGLRREAAIASA